MTGASKCPCGGSYETTEIVVPMDIAGSLVEITGVPQEDCDSCGSRTYSPWTLERIEAVMRGAAVDPQFDRLSVSTSS